jgi:hypothetical protein
MQLPLLSVVDIPPYGHFALNADPLADILPRLALETASHLLTQPGERSFTALWQFDEQGLFLTDVRDILVEHSIMFEPVPNGDPWTGSAEEALLRSWLMADPASPLSCRTQPVPAHWVADPLALVISGRGEPCGHCIRGGKGHWYRHNRWRALDEVAVPKVTQ